MIDSSANFDLSRFIGCILTQVCFGAHEIRFNFLPEQTIHSETTVLLSTGGKEEVIFPIEDDSSTVLKLLESKVVAVDLQSEWLTIEFTNESRVKFMSDNTGYESFQIWQGSDFLIM